MGRLLDCDDDALPGCWPRSSHMMLVGSVSLLLSRNLTTSRYPFGLESPVTLRSSWPRLSLDPVEAGQSPYKDVSVQEIGSARYSQTP